MCVLMREPLKIEKLSAGLCPAPQSIWGTVMRSGRVLLFESLHVGKLCEGLFGEVEVFELGMRFM